MIEERIQTDVLCIGGGIAGLMAAIRAAELGASVVVAEKGNVQCSGCGRMGNDHFETYIPEIHGSDKEAWIEELLRTAKGEILIGKDLLRAQFLKAYDIVKLWHEWGINMKYKGKWEFAGHSFPGHPMTHVKYEGRFQKKILTREAKKRGATVLNRVMMLDLIRDNDRVIGAIGVHTRENKLLIFEAKSIILGTGKCSRLYPPLTPGWLSNDPHGGALSGDGRAMAYRAGAMLQNLEMPQRHIGPKYFTRFGQATWIGVVKDAYGKPAGTFVDKPNRRYGDMICEVNKLTPEQYTQNGNGPLYMDCTEITEPDHSYMMHWMENEGYTAMTEYMAAEGIDFRKHPIEFATYPLRGGGLVMADGNAKTSLEGLYAAGDEAFGDISAAATFGYISGENAATYTQAVKKESIDKDNPVIKKVQKLIDDIRGHENGPDWEETSIALQQTMSDYVGKVRNEALLKQGLQHLKRIRQKARETLMAKNPHEVMRCLEVFNLLELGELTFLMALNRKETRGLHNRPDYPFTDPTLNQAQIIQKNKAETILNWKSY